MIKCLAIAHPLMSINVPQATWITWYHQIIVKSDLGDRIHQYPIFSLSIWLLPQCHYKDHAKQIISKSDLVWTYPSISHLFFVHMVTATVPLQRSCQTNNFEVRFFSVTVSINITSSLPIWLLLQCHYKDQFCSFFLC